MNTWANIWSRSCSLIMGRFIEFEVVFLARLLSSASVYSPSQKRSNQTANSLSESAKPFLVACPANTKVRIEPSTLGSGLIPRPVIFPCVPCWKPAVCGCRPLSKVLCARSWRKNKVARCPRVKPSTLSRVRFCPSKVAKTCSLRVPAF